MTQTVTILGGGPLGLAVGFYCRRSDKPFAIYEAADHTGGNAVTYEHRGFRFDSGAHRFHDKDPEITQDVRELLGQELRPCTMPSHICEGSSWIRFPLSPLDLLFRLGTASFDAPPGRFLLLPAAGLRHDLRAYGRSLW